MVRRVETPQLSIACEETGLSNGQPIAWAGAGRQQHSLDAQPAASQGGTMTKIVETVRIAADADSLWQEIGQFSAVGNWHPMLAKVESEGECEGCLRTAEGRDGSRQTERLIKLDPERRLYRYRMEATAMPIRDYVGELAVEGNANSTSKVVWSA